MTELWLESGTSKFGERTGGPGSTLQTLARPAYRRVTAIDSGAMPAVPLFLVGGALLGALLMALGASWMYAIGARPGLGRRLAGARGISVGEVSRLRAAPSRAVRVAGRVRCTDPLLAPDGERLVAFHRDVEVQSSNGHWRTIERLRETRSFELWDHAGSLAVDPAQAAEPLISIPLVWEGRPEELSAEHASGLARIAAEEGPPVAARAVTRTISEVDRLLVLAEVHMDGRSAARLDPPRGGFVISSLELDAAMRLLGGPHRRQLPVAIGVLAFGGLLLVVGVLASLASWIAAR